MKSYLASLGWAAAIIATLVFAAAVCALVYFAGPVDRFHHWRKKRVEFIKNERLNRFNVAAFRGARKFDDPRWPT